MSLTFSSNHFKNWERCPKKFELDTIENLQWPTNPKGFQLGLAVHQMMDWQAKKIKEEFYLPKMSPEIQTVYQKLAQSEWGQLEVLASEWPFALKLKGVWVEGRIDRLALGQVERNQPSVWVLDWKTGTAIPKDPENDWQTQIYLAAVFLLQKELGLEITPEQLGFCYVQANLQQEGVQTAIIDYSQHKHQSHLQRMNQAAEAMRTANNYPLPSLCPDAYCPYSPVCGIRH